MVQISGPLTTRCGIGGVTGGKNPESPPPGGAGGRKGEGSGQGSGSCGADKGEPAPLHPGEPCDAAPWRPPWGREGGGSSREGENHTNKPPTDEETPGKNSKKKGGLGTRRRSRKGWERERRKPGPPDKSTPHQGDGWGVGWLTSDHLATAIPSRVLF